MKLSLKKDLTPIREKFLAQIDADANRALESYRTSGNYAVAVYAQKRAELSAYDSGEKSAEELVMLSTEALALKERPEVILDSWRAKVAAEDAALPKIEAYRQVAKQKVRDAQTPAEIEAVVADLVWP
jgi:hypothetical protein